MNAESNETEVCPFLDSSESEIFQKYKYPVTYWWIVLHELFGHGTGKMMIQEGEGKFNFNAKCPPINPLTGKPITSWYRPGQTWTGQFGDLATTVDECRAELVGAYLMDDQELLSLFGFTSESETSAGDCKFFRRYLHATLCSSDLQQLHIVCIYNSALRVSKDCKTSTETMA